MLRGDGSNLAAARFRILEPLGAGGFGAVYAAQDVRTGQRVAIKQLDDTSADSVARFKQEFRALADRHHENLVGLKELIEEDGSWLIVMELVPGVDFLRYVARDPPGADNDNVPAGYDEARLRGALAGIAEGLRALHGYGVVHRDLKPSNVRVRPDGRAVLLDFGLVTSVDPQLQSTHAMGVGTVLYMAPEQAGGQQIGPACDLYALGACLFEALTGRAPFLGDHAIKILLEKQRVEAPRASSLVARVPADLDELCARLLAIDPAHRPSAEEVLRILNKVPAQPVSLRPSLPDAQDEVFAGREVELSHLERALARTHEGELRVLLVEGESGVGKSELVGEFLRRARREHPRLIALRGRCYENEQVSYKAFDGCIDELARLLRRMPEQELAALLPARAALLGQLFPVLRNVKAIAKAPRDGLSADLAARRLEAFAALTELLARLAEDRPVMLVLDDLQWADAESFRLLSALCQEKPQPPVLLAGTVRPRDELEPEVADRLAEIRQWKNVDVIPLSGLPREQARALAGQLLSPGAPAAWLDLIADESQGHPLFMSELVQYTESHDFAARGKLTLEAALRARIDRLSAQERALLELVAFAARPHPLPVFAQALSGSLEEAARSLLKAKLLRQRRGLELGCYHDRIRHAAVELVAKSRLPVLHHQLAAALAQTPDSDVSEQAHHWDLAGEQERACEAYELAATRALDAMAFSRAALLCQRAIELEDNGASERSRRMTVQRADALACAGRSAEAALLYERAAALATGDARIKLRSRAANHLMLGAKVEAGFAAARALLAELGFSLPIGTRAALARYAWEALRVSLQQLWRRRKSERADPRELVALGVVREMMYTVGLIHPLAYVLLAIQYVRRAARVGSPVDSALAMTTRGFFRTIQGSLAAGRPLMDEARKLMEGQHDPLAEATQLFTIGSAHTVTFDHALAEPYLERARRIAQEHCPDHPWLSTSIRYHLCLGWYACGHHERFARESESWLVEARERNDALALALLANVGLGALRHLMRDAPEAALAELDATIAPIPSEPYSFIQLSGLRASILCRVYQGGRGALDHLEAHERRHAGAFVLGTVSGRQGTGALRVLALASAYVAASADERVALGKALTRVAGRLAVSRQAFTSAVGLLALGQLDALKGEREHALLRVGQALAIYRQLNHMSARVAEYVLGLLEGGEGGRDRCTAMLDELRAQGWRKPERAILLGAPLYPLIAGAPAAPARRPAPTLLMDRYEVTGHLGSGGFGSVVVARDVRSGQPVAIKELTRLGPEALARFKQEFRALSGLVHANIVQLDTLFEHRQSWYIAMELVEGVQLFSYVRPDGVLDATRLRTAFTGLSRALLALHGRGFVHRDVKSENVLVTAQGRAVLIDFGLSAREADARETGPAGSVQYAAPEQLRGSAPTSAADVFALGGCLYQALTGSAPFAATPLEPRAALAARKPPRLTLSGEHAALARLTLAMLAEEPASRPTLDALITELSGQPAEPVATPDELPDGLSFAGREVELARLQQALARSAQEGFALLVVEGESGLGKSALVAEFAAHAQRAQRELLLLPSRCYENEQVALKAFDGACDRLARYLQDLPAAAAELLLPRRVALLAQMFPVLASVEPIACASKKGLPADPSARKQQGREVFVQLLEMLCGQCPLLIVIDDLQWADEDSFELLRALAARGSALPILVVATVRPSVDLEPRARELLSGLRALPRVDWLELSALDEGAALALARVLLGAEVDPARLREIVRECKGHPLFLRELVEHQRRGLGIARAALTLDSALAARIDSLPQVQRALLSRIALAEKPYAAHVYARALGRSELPREALIGLLQHGLVERRGEKLGCHHDRIRHAALTRLALDERRHAARELAGALAHELRADAAECARLWEEAGEHDQATVAFERAGDAALESLAFARAAQHYQRALALLAAPAEDARVHGLLVRQGQALVQAGRSADAAQLFQRAAQHVQGEQALRLRLWAAQALLQSAQVEAGLNAASGLLREIGLSLPATESAAKARIVWERARMSVGGSISGGPRPATSTRQYLELDALQALCSPVRLISFLPGTALFMQYLRRALATGHPVHMARALGHVAYLRALNAPDADMGPLFERSMALAESTSEPSLIAEIWLVRGLATSAKFTFQAAASNLWHAHELLVAECPGHAWLLTSTRMYLGSFWRFCNAFGETQRHMGTWLEEARVRDDAYAYAALSGFGGGSLRLAIAGDVEGALAEVDAAMAPWPRAPFATTHWGAFLTHEEALSATPGTRLLTYMDARPELERAFLMRTPVLRAAFLSLRVRTLLAARAGRARSEQAALLARARADQRALRSTRGAVPLGFAHSANAAIALADGRTRQAVEELRACERAWANLDIGLATGTRYALATLQGGDRGRLVREEIMERVRSEGWQDERLGLSVRMLIPLFLLE